MHRPYFSAGSTFTNSQAFGRHSKQSGFCFPLRGSLRAAPIACSRFPAGLWLDRYFRFTITVLAHKATSLFYGSMVIRSTFIFYFIQIFTDSLRKASSRICRHALVLASSCSFLSFQGSVYQAIWLITNFWVHKIQAHTEWKTRGPHERSGTASG